jgi:DNA-binding response OmpR family regulator
MPRILIVEDDQGFRTMLEMMIRLEGHEVYLAADGKRGLEQAKSRKPDIILTDLDMPEMTGMDLCKAVKADPSLANAYVIMLTGQGGQSTKLDGLRAGVDDFLVKPSSAGEIHGRLEIAQKVMAVIASEREARERADKVSAALQSATTSINEAEKAMEQAAAAMAKKDVATLTGAMKKAGDSIAKAKAAIAAGAPAPVADSWL